MHPFSLTVSQCLQPSLNELNVLLLKFLNMNTCWIDEWNQTMTMYGFFYGRT